MEQLDSLSIEELQALLESEAVEAKKLKMEITGLETAIQEIGRSNEREEERMMSTFNKKIKQLRTENNSMSMKIEMESEYVRTTLTNKYNSILQEREELQAVLANQERDIITRLQNEIKELTEQAAELESKLNNGEQIEKSRAEEILKKLLDAGDETKVEYDKELAKLSDKVNALIQSNKELMQKISDAQIELMTEPDKGDNEQQVLETPEHKMRRYSHIPTKPIKKDKRRMSRPA